MVFKLSLTFSNLQCILTQSSKLEGENIFSQRLSSEKIQSFKQEKGSNSLGDNNEHFREKTEENNI